jgi:hypothetical protein
MSSEQVSVAASTASAAKNKEVLIAVIGLIGVLATAGFSNWEKIFPPPNIVKSQFTGYTPTGDAQVELRYFMEITGMRANLKQMQAGVIEHFKKQTEAIPGATPEFTAKMFKVLEEEMNTQYDEVMNAFVPVASKHLAVPELQELNKFYSTPAMREFLRKQPIINSEFLPIAMAQIQKNQERIASRVDALMKEEMQRKDAVSLGGK